MQQRVGAICVKATSKDVRVSGADVWAPAMAEGLVKEEGERPQGLRGCAWGLGPNPTQLRERPRLPL